MNTLISLLRNDRTYSLYKNFFFFYNMSRPFKVFSADFPLVNQARHNQHLKVINHTVDILKQSLNHDHQSLHIKSRGKQNHMFFKKTENSLQKFNKKQNYAGSLAINLVGQTDGFKNMAIHVRELPRSKSSFLTTYQSFNRKLQICRRFFSATKKQDDPVEEKEKNVKRIDAHRIMMPLVLHKPKLRLKIDRPEH